MSRTEPPFDPSEAEEMRQQEQNYAAKMAQEVVDLAYELADYFDKPPYRYRADDLLDIEEAHYGLFQILNKAKKNLP